MNELEVRFWWFISLKVFISESFVKGMEFGWYFGLCFKNDILLLVCKILRF